MIHDPSSDSSSASAQQPEEREPGAAPELVSMDLGPALENGDRPAATGTEESAAVAAEVIEELAGGADPASDTLPAGGEAPAGDFLAPLAATESGLPGAEESAPVEASIAASTGEDSAATPAETAAGDAAETPVPATDPVFLETFARDLDAVRAQVAELRSRWDAENAIAGDHAALHDALVAAENEFYGLVDRLRPAHAPADEFALAPAETVEKREGFKFDEAPAPGVGKTTTKPREPKEQGSMVREMIGIVLGGLMAIPIAQLILWWLPVIGKDPVGLGPKMPAFLKFLVPEKFQGGPEEVEPALPTPPRQNGKPSKNGDTPSFQMDKFNVPMGEPEIIGVPMPMPEPAPVAAPMPEVVPPAQPPPASPRHAVVNAPAVSGDDVGKALRGASEADKALEAEADSAQLPALAKDHFVKYCALGYAVAFVDAKSTAQQIPSRLGTARGLIGGMSHNAATVTRIGKYAASWMKNPKNRESSGVILAGRVHSTEQQGKLHVTRIELPDAAKTQVVVLSDKELGEPVDAQVIVLGAIVAEPAANVSGYQGGEPEIVWAGMWASVAEAP